MFRGTKSRGTKGGFINEKDQRSKSIGSHRRGRRRAFPAGTAACGQQPNEYSFEAEKAAITLDAGIWTQGTAIQTELDEDENEVGKYVRFLTPSTQDADGVKDSVTFTFRSDREAKATITFVVANPKTNPDSNWINATKASDITKITINGTAADMTAFDTAIGTLYDGASALAWKEVRVETTLLQGENTVVFANNTNYSVTYEGMENLYATDTICLDKIVVSTVATVTAEASQAE